MLVSGQEGMGQRSLLLPDDATSSGWYPAPSTHLPNEPVFQTSSLPRASCSFQALRSHLTHSLSSSLSSVSLLSIQLLSFLKYLTDISGIPTQPALPHAHADLCNNALTWIEVALKAFITQHSACAILALLPHQNCSSVLAGDEAPTPQCGAQGPSPTPGRSPPCIPVSMAMSVLSAHTSLFPLSALEVLEDLCLLPSPAESHPPSMAPRRLGDGPQASGHTEGLSPERAVPAPCRHGMVCWWVSFSIAQGRPLALLPLSSTWCLCRA